MELTPESLLKRVSRNVSQTWRVLSGGCVARAAARQCLQGWDRIEGFKENQMSSLCVVLSYADSSHSETKQAPWKKEDRLQQTLL